MSENTAKLNKFRKEIESCSESEAAEIIEAAQKAADEALRTVEKETRSAVKHNTRKTVDKLTNDERKRVSEKRFSEGRRVLLHRTKLAEEFFSRVEAAIKAETAKETYRDYIGNSLCRAEKHFPLDNSEIYCMEKDIAVVKELLSGKCAQVLASDSIALGGIIVKIPESGIIMDLSLDAALEKERENFSALKEMQL